MEHNINSLLKGRKGLKLLRLPHMQKIVFVDSGPFPYHSKHLGRQMPLQHLACLNINGGHIFTVKGMDMRRVMLRLLKIHTNNDPVESGQYRYYRNLLFVVTYIISRYREMPIAIPNIF